VGLVSIPRFPLSRSGPFWRPSCAVRDFNFSLAICSMASWWGRSPCLRRRSPRVQPPPPLSRLRSLLDRGCWILRSPAGPVFWHGFAQLSLTQTLRTFEQGLLSAGLVLGINGRGLRSCCTRERVAAARYPVASKVHPLGAMRDCDSRRAAIATQIRKSVDVTEDRRKLFPPADQRLLATLRLPLS